MNNNILEIEIKLVNYEETMKKLQELKKLLDEISKIQIEVK